MRVGGRLEDPTVCLHQDMEEEGEEVEEVEEGGGWSMEGPGLLIDTEMIGTEGVLLLGEEEMTSEDLQEGAISEMKGAGGEAHQEVHLGVVLMEEVEVAVVVEEDGVVVVVLMIILVDLMVEVEEKIKKINSPTTWTT